MWQAQESLITLVISNKSDFKKKWALRENIKLG